MAQDGRADSCAGWETRMRFAVHPSQGQMVVFGVLWLWGVVEGVWRGDGYLR